MANWLSTSQEATPAVGSHDESERPTAGSLAASESVVVVEAVADGAVRQRRLRQPDRRRRARGGERRNREPSGTSSTPGSPSLTDPPTPAAFEDRYGPFFDEIRADLAES